MIVVTTPTGQIGRQVLDHLIEGPDPVRVIARDPSRLAPRVRDRVEVVHGSHADPEVVTAALTGADSAFWVVPPRVQADSIQEHVLDFVRPLCEGINRSGVRRVVGVSSLGRAVPASAGPISAIFAMDHLVESTGVSYRALCMPGFMENMLRQVEPLREHGTFFLPMSGDRPNPTCATRDIAAVAAGLLHDRSWSGQDQVPVLGPEDLSQNDLARIMSEVLDRPVRFQQVPGERYKASLMRRGASQASAQGLLDMTTAVDRGLYEGARRDPRFATPTTFRQWCTEVLRPAVLG